MKKSFVRKKILEIRKKKFTQNISINFKIITKLLKELRVKRKVIGGYYPYNNEFDCTGLLKRFEKKKYVLSLPKIKENFQMDFYNWKSNEPLLINKYGIPEPISDRLRYPDIFLVPLVAFDKYLNRVGYGGGFYDRYIEKIKRKKKVILIGLAYSFQEIKKISTNKFDMKLDIIITEKKILK